MSDTKKKDEASKLLWLDMEMTGLDVEKERPIEVAAVVTDWSFAALGDYHAVIHQPPEILVAMDDWNKTHHGKSGLLAKIPEGEAMAAVDQNLASFILSHFGGGAKPERAVLAGNSINQDRAFIKRYMPRTEATLHYRMLDVTSWKVVFAGLYKRKFEKKEAHRAVEDIHESINELKFYLSHIRLD